MKVNMIDTQIENNINPFIVFQVNSFNSEEEMTNVKNNISKFLTDEEIDILEKNTIAADFSLTVDYLIINKSFVDEFTRLINKCGIKFELVNIIEQIWNLNSVKEFVGLFGEEDLSVQLTQQSFKCTFEKVNEILKVIVESQFNVNDVLDKISEKGIDSLNELNKYILEKESH